MKNCEECRSLIELYLDDALTRDDKKRFLAHISSCDECRKELDFAKNIKQTLAVLPTIELPNDFIGTVRAKIEAEGKTKKRFGTYFVRYGSLAACLVLAVAVSQSLSRPNIPKSNDISQNEAVEEGAEAPTQLYTYYAGENTPTPTKEKSVLKSRTVPEAEISEGTEYSYQTNTENDGIAVVSMDTDANVAEESAFKSVPDDTVTLTVAEHSFDKATEIITAHTQSVDGIYTLSREVFNLILAELGEQEIFFTQVGELSDDAVMFVLKTQ